MSGLLSFLSSDANARKVFGKRELKIIEKQLMGVALTQSEKNRLSRDIRRKFEFVKNAARYSDEFGLKKGAAVRARITAAIETIKGDKWFGRVKRIWLFGSAVTGARTLRSDVDLAVEFDNVSKREATEFRARILGRLSEGVDVQVFSVLPQKIKKEILKKGRKEYERAD
ncbi:MAG: nucleotidyltransferase domain-containing protein [Candidatus Micrarchaeota archaeon]